MTVAAVDLII